MRTSQLRHFEAVARHRNFVHAAEELHLSQPALTRSIQALERQLGQPLFDRTARKVELSPVGIFILERVRALISSHGQLERDIQSLHGLETGELHVGFGPITAETVLGASVGRFVHRYPGVQVRVILLEADEMANAITTGRIDALVGEPMLRKPEPALDRIELKRRKGFFYCRTGHPLLNHQRLRLNDLTEYALVGFTFASRSARGMPVGAKFGLVDRLTGKLVPHVECHSIAACKRIVAASDAISVGTLPMIEAELRAGVLSLIPLATPGLETGYSIITPSGRALSPAVQEFIRIVLEVDNEMVEAAPGFLIQKQDAKIRGSGVRRAWTGIGAHPTAHFQQHGHRLQQPSAPKAPRFS